MYPYSAWGLSVNMRLEHALSIFLDYLSHLLCEHILHTYLSGLYSIAGVKRVPFVQFTAVYFALANRDGANISLTYLEPTGMRMSPFCRSIVCLSRQCLFGLCRRQPKWSISKDGCGSSSTS